MNSLRILVVLPLYGGSLPVGRFCVSALRELGHLTDVFEAPDFYGAYRALDTLSLTQDRHEYLRNSYLQVVSQAVAAKVETFEPDLVLALAQAPLSHQTLKRLQRDKVATAMWVVEDFRLFTYWQSYANFYDLFAVIQKDPFPEQLAALGQHNALYLPLAAQPDFHRPLELSPLDRHTFGSDLSFMGAGYPNRRMAFRELAHRDFKIWGNDWEDDHVLAPLVQRGGARVSSEDCVRIFNASRINLNLHSSIHADRLVSGGDFVNPRTFEIAACGGFQLVDWRTLLPELFTGEELAVFTDMPGLSRAIEHFLAHPEEREAMARKARARVLAEHTYAARMQTLLDFAAQRLPDWPRSRERTDLFPPDFPAELRQDILNLLGRLKLPASVDFEDLARAVRQQQGVLSDLDAAILFLDEWRKQYGASPRNPG